MSAPSERKSRLSPGGGIGGSDRSFGSGSERSKKYTDRREFSSAHSDRSPPSQFGDLTREQRVALRSVAFWLDDKASRFHQRWAAPVDGMDRVCVCFGNFPDEQVWRSNVWLWHPSGYLHDLGVALMGTGRMVAHDLAKAIGEAHVLDCTQDYARAA